jgi:hypothetical protein
VSDQNQVVSMGSLEPLGAVVDPQTMETSPVVVHVKNAVPRQGKLRLDFYADVNETGKYDGVGEIKLKKDHAWRIAPLNGLDPASGTVDEQTVDVRFSHNTLFVDIDAIDEAPSPPETTGIDATVRLAKMDPYVGKLVEVRVVDRGNAHVVGLHRYAALPQASATCVLAGVLEPGVEYDVEIYADANGDHAYQAPGKPGGDGGWKVKKTAGDDGIDLAFDPTSTPSSPDVRFVY